MVGAALTGRVIIIDDVLTAGTAIRGAASLIRGAGAEVAGVLTALDRQERGEGERSAAAETADSIDAPVTSIITLDDVLAFLGETGEAEEHRAEISAYRRAWGVAAR